MTANTFTHGPTPNTIRSADGKLLTAPEDQGCGDPRERTGHQMVGELDTRSPPRMCPKIDLNMIFIPTQS
jgi:hypothetical protein